MKKLFGGINITWKKLIIFAILIAIYTALMAIIPITKETSFRDIAVQFEWWVIFGAIIAYNSNSPLDSALKCFVFFLVSQPLIYLFQVPFSSMGWELFKYYPYWFKWTLLTLPMGFIGYYIKKNNILSVFILMPALILLAFTGVGYLTSAMENFPHHLLSFIFCFVFIIILIINIFESKKLRLLAFSLTIISIIVLVILKGGISSEFETYKSLEEYKLDKDAMVSFFSGTAKGNVELIESDDHYNIKLNGRMNGKYNFTITSNNEEYSFEYHYDKKTKSIVLNKTRKN